MHDGAGLNILTVIYISVGLLHLSPLVAPLMEHLSLLCQNAHPLELPDDSLQCDRIQVNISNPFSR